jgi:hypothetical protein
MYQRKIMPMPDQGPPTLPGLPNGYPMMPGGMPPMRMPQAPQGQGGILGMLPMLGMLGAKPEGGTSLMDMLKGMGQPQQSAGGALNLQPGFLTGGLGNGAIGLNENFLTNLLRF